MVQVNPMTPYVCPRHGLECVRVLYVVTVRGKQREYERFECPLVVSHRCTFVKPNKWRGYKELRPATPRQGRERYDGE